MLMFLFGIVAMIGAAFCLMAFGVLAVSSLPAFLIVVSVLYGAWKLAGKDWGISRATDHYEALKGPPRAAPGRDSVRGTRAVIVRRRQFDRYAGLTSMDDFDDEDVPL